MHRFVLRLGLVVALLAAACAQAPHSPLTQAAAHNDGAALRRLLSAGHQADERAGTWTPLIWAARTGSVEAIAVLLDAGVDVNRPGPTGDDWDATPLQHAILQRQPAAVRLLLAHGADPRLAGEDGATPLSRAVSAGTLNGPDRPMFGGCRVETVRALVAHDPTLRLQRNAAWTDALWWARTQRCEDVLQLVAE